MEKVCQRCKKKFKIVVQEREFYEKMGLPLPEDCPFCRQEKRLLLRNERRFFKYPCKKCGQEMVTTINPNKGLTVYCLNCYQQFRATVDLTKIE